MEMGFGKLETAFEGNIAADLLEEEILRLRSEVQVLEQQRNLLRAARESSF